jgi:hypothetical protein
MPRRKTTIDRNPLESLPSETAAEWTASPQLHQPGDAEAQKTSEAAEAHETSGADVGHESVSNHTDSAVVAILDAQNAALAAGFSVVEATLAFNRAALVAWTDACSQAQQPNLETSDRSNVR